MEFTILMIYFGIAYLAITKIKSNKDFEIRYSLG